MIALILILRKERCNYATGKLSVTNWLHEYGGAFFICRHVSLHINICNYIIRFYTGFNAAFAKYHYISRPPWPKPTRYVISMRCVHWLGSVTLRRDNFCRMTIDVNAMSVEKNLNFRPPRHRLVVNFECIPQITRKGIHYRLFQIYFQIPSFIVTVLLVTVAYVFVVWLGC